LLNSLSSMIKDKEVVMWKLSLGNC
jgi:hypothetical protein